MELSRDKQRIQKGYPKLGIKFYDTLEYLLDLCKGRTVRIKDKWFYSLFLDRTVAGAPTSISEVISKLRSAWWIEEDDLIQEIIYFNHKISDMNYVNPCGVLARRIRDYICEQRVFSRQVKWVDKYRATQLTETHIQKSFDLSFVFDNKIPLTLYNKYLLYLSGILDLSKEKMSVFLLQSNRSVKRSFAKLRKDLEEKKCHN